MSDHSFARTISHADWSQSFPQVTCIWLPWGCASVCWGGTIRQWWVARILVAGTEVAWNVLACHCHRLWPIIVHLKLTFKLTLRICSVVYWLSCTGTAKSVYPKGVGGDKPAWVAFDRQVCSACVYLLSWWSCLHMCPLRRPVTLPLFSVGAAFLCILPGGGSWAASRAIPHTKVHLLVLPWRWHSPGQRATCGECRNTTGSAISCTELDCSSPLTHSHTRTHTQVHWFAVTASPFPPLTMRATTRWMTLMWGRKLSCTAGPSRSQWVTTSLTSRRRYAAVWHLQNPIVLWFQGKFIQSRDPAFSLFTLKYLSLNVKQKF